MNWRGVIPAITTSFDVNGAVDHPALAQHCRWLIEQGCAGIVCCGSLGEAATLSFEEKLAIATTCVNAVGNRAPVVLGIAALSTAEAVALAHSAEGIGCSGLMVLPPYVYSTDWREMRTHVNAVISATKLSCMLYNWFLPLLRLDGLPKFVQYIKWMQAAVGRGMSNVRAPRLALEGAELGHARSVFEHAMRTRPTVRR